MTGLSHGANLAIADAVPVGRPVDLRRRRHRPGRSRRADRARQPPSHGYGLRPARGRPGLRGVRRAATASAGGVAFQRRQLLHRRPAAGGRDHDGPHPPRLGPRPEADADRQGLRRPAGGRRADRLRGDHRRRSLAERLRPADEPQHADRDRGRLRLHGRRLHGLDAGGRASARPGPSTWSGRTRWWSASSRRGCATPKTGRRGRGHAAARRPLTSGCRESSAAAPTWIRRSRSRLTPSSLSIAARRASRARPGRCGFERWAGCGG